MNRIRILAVEDDPIYAETIRMIVEQTGYELVGLFSNGKDALLAIRATKPDLLLLDIKIDGPITGIQIAEQVAGEEGIPTIFITSFREKEIFEKAKSTKPIAYILKPFDSLMLQNTIELAVAQFAGEDRGALNEKDIVVKDGFFIKEKNSLFKVPMAGIHYIQSEDKYCTLHTDDRKFVLRISLQDILSSLPENFIRIHRSLVVDASKIQRVDMDNNELQLKNITLPIGATYKNMLLSRIKKLG
jgi:DNA-binding LytR/AlgR family response regulator